MRRRMERKRVNRGGEVRVEERRAEERGGHSKESVCNGKQQNICQPQTLFLFLNFVFPFLL